MNKEYSTINQRKQQGSQKSNLQREKIYYFIDLNLLQRKLFQISLKETKGGTAICWIILTVNDDFKEKLIYAYQRTNFIFKLILCRRDVHDDISASIP